MHVGIIGLGAIGRAVAANILKSGFAATVWNRSPEPTRELVAQGARAATEVAQALRCDVTLSVLFDDTAVSEVFLESGVLRQADPGTIHVCMSTISTSMAQSLSEAHAAHGVGFIAAPVFGRPDAAAAAQLVIATAGPRALLDRVEPVLSRLGRTFRMGDDPRHAHLAKIAGNFLIGCAVEAMSESATLVRSHGCDPAVFLAMLTETLFAAPVYTSYAPSAAAGVGRSPANARIALKDIALALDEAKAVGARVPFAEVRQGLLREETAR